ncbi:hypothetical protein AA15237_0476 [Komagataeibacter xylinus NBRC 15237]|nr:hypothetical protein AA15237_0476 [Komagataeibacter xylinus NBRC 15237]
MAWVAPLAMKARMKIAMQPPIIVARPPAPRTARPRMAPPTTAWQDPVATAMAAGMTITRT